MIDYEKVLLDLVTLMVEGKTNVSVRIMPTLGGNEVLLYVYANSDGVAHPIGRHGVVTSPTRQMTSVASRKEGKRVTIRFESYQDAFRILFSEVGHTKEINIGMPVNTHGLRGEMKVKVLTDFLRLRFQKGATVHLQLTQGQFDLKVQHVQKSKGQLLVKLEGYDDINQVGGWKGSMPIIREKEL